jgi:hypothetical protein
VKTEGTPLVKRTEFNFNCPADKIQNKNFTGKFYEKLCKSFI